MRCTVAVAVAVSVATVTAALTVGLVALPQTASAATTTTIHAAQGTTRISPFKGQQVKVTGIVTAIRSTGSSRGYWIQDPNPDGDPATSEGIFVDR